MILCRTKKTEIPLAIDSAGIKIYTLEQLCYYIYNNIYMIEPDFISERLISFFDVGIEEKELAKKVEQMKNSKMSLGSILVFILKSVDYYSDNDIEKISKELAYMSSGSVHEKLKLRGDSFLRNESFCSAIKFYNKIITEERDRKLSGRFYSDVYHNLAVAYAGLFLFSEAAEAFKESYIIGQHEDSEKCYEIALRLSKGEYSDTKYFENAKYSDQYRKLLYIEGLREDKKIKEFNDAIEEFSQDLKENYKKYTS